MRAIAFAVCFLMLGLGALPAQAEKRVALVIGNSQYQNVAALPNPANDAAAVATLFRSAGFDKVELRLNQGNADLRRTVGDFADAAADADIAVIYFAGHGIEIDGNNFIIPVDARLARDYDVEDEAFALDRLLKAIEPARRLRLIILDACRDNPFARTMRRTVASRSVGRGLGRVEPSTSDTLIAFAAKAGSTALDGDGLNSPFTAALLRHIATPGLDVRLAFGEVRDDVMDLTHRAQEPFVYGSIGGRSVSLVEALPGVDARPAGNDPAKIWEATRETGSQAVLEDFIRQFGATPYGSMARARLEELKKLAALPPGGGVVSRPADVASNPDSSVATLQRTLSKDFTIDPDVLNTVVNHPFFANTPTPRLESYGEKRTGKADESTSNYKLRWLPHGISIGEGTYDYSSPWQGPPRGTYRFEGVPSEAYAGNHLVSLAYQSRNTSTFPGKRPETTTSRTTLIKLENLTGTLFPMSVGNKFAYKTTSRGDESSNGDSVDDLNCRVTERRSGSEFQRDLGGDAYVIICDWQYSYTKIKKQNTGKLTKIFFSDLGVFLGVDTIDPKQVFYSKDYHDVLTSFALMH